MKIKLVKPRKSLSPEHKKKISDSLKGYIKSEKHRRRLSESLKGRKREPWSEERKRKHSEILKKADCSSKKIGRKFSEETKLKMSQSQKKRSNRPPVIRGKDHWNWRGGITNKPLKGKRKLTDEDKERLRLSRIGMVHGKGWKLSDEARRNISKGHKGSKSHLWKGGITSVNAMARSSVEYKLWRDKVFQRDNYTCSRCKKRGIRLHAHHIIPFALDIDKRFDISNGTTLCVDCHKK